MTFGEKLKSLRMEVGKSQAQVANEISNLSTEISISQTYLSALEKRTAAPREEVLDVLAEYYSVPVTHFFDANEDENSASGLETAIGYIRALKNRKLLRKQANFARSNERRDKDDDIEQSINRIQHDEHDKYLDT